MTYGLCKKKKERLNKKKILFLKCEKTPGSKVYL